MMLADGGGVQAELLKTVLELGPEDRVELIWQPDIGDPPCDLIRRPLELFEVDRAESSVQVQEAEVLGGKSQRHQRVAIALQLCGHRGIHVLFPYRPGLLAELLIPGPVDVEAVALYVLGSDVRFFLAAAAEPRGEAANYGAHDGANRG
jgi:hypothetical protein